jgi:hypothetical protein
MLILIFRWLIVVQSDCVHLQWRLLVTDGVIKTEGIAGRFRGYFALLFRYLGSCQRRLDKAKQSKAAGKYSLTAI